MRTAMLGGSQDLEHHPIHLATGDDRGSYTVITLNKILVHCRVIQRPKNTLLTCIALKHHAQ